MMGRWIINFSMMSDEGDFLWHKNSVLIDLVRKVRFSCCPPGRWTCARAGFKESSSNWGVNIPYRGRNQGMEPVGRLQADQAHNTGTRLPVRKGNAVLRIFQSHFSFSARRLVLHRQKRVDDSEIMQQSHYSEHRISTTPPRVPPGKALQFFVASMDCY